MTTLNNNQRPPHTVDPVTEVEGKGAATQEEEYRVNPAKALWQFFRGERARLGLSLVLFVLKHSPVWLMPVFIGRITHSIEIGVLQGDYERGLHSLLLNLVLVCLIIAQNIPSHMGFMALFSRAKRNMEACLRSGLVRRLQELSISYHGQMRSGRLQAKVLRDVESVERLSHMLVNGVVPGVLGVGFALIYTFSKQPWIGWFFVVTIPVVALLRKVFVFRIRKRNREFRRNVEMMSGRVSEMIEMIPISRAHAVEGEEIRRMDDELEHVRSRGVKLDMINAFFACANWVSFQVIRMVCLAVTSYIALAYPEKMSISDVVKYFTFFEVIIRSVQQVLNVYPMLARGFESIHSISEVLDCPDLEQNRGKRKVRDIIGEYEFQDVTFRYKDDDAPAIQDFSLHVNPGESIALVGASGAGKSTLMNLLIGFHRPTAGRILLDGRDMQKLDLRTYRKFLAVVPQETVLFSGSVRENIAFGLREVSDDRIWEALEIANASDFVTRLPEGLDTPIGEHGGWLSGGQRQRLSIARAIIRRPKVIIFDEATSSLDAVAESLVQDAIDRLIAERTTFVVAHRLSTIRKCDRIVVMKDGRCIESGTHEELMDLQGEFHRLQTLQS
ncbi:MAG: ATP-binding cassette domain-containing protein [Bacteroidetes bacterium]|nr:ATP-binding cassette domain-containing protein [Bacteroidota bacterium]